MIWHENFAQLAATLQSLDGLGLSQDRNFFSDKGELNGAKKTLRDMKNVKRILDTLCANVKAEIEGLTRRIMPASLHHGLESIPDELLARVLVLDIYDSNSRIRAEELRFVNKRFHAVVSSSPKCWSKVRRGTPQRKIFVDAPVHLETTKEKALEDISYYQGRIHHLEIDTDSSIGDDYLAKLDLSSVKSLVLRGDGRVSLRPFSQLTSLSCQYIPQLCGLQLTHCELDIPIIYDADGDYEGQNWGYELLCGLDYNEFARFLTSIPSLQSLSFPLDTDSCAFWHNPDIVTLPNLKYLHIRCNCLCEEFLKVLECPALEVMDVLLDKFNNEQDNTGTGCIPTLKFPSVKSLTIRGATIRRINFKENLSVELSDIHHTFPCLRSLSIDGEFLLCTRVGYARLGLQDQSGSLSLDHLKSISFCIPLQPIERYDHDRATGLPCSDPSRGFHDNWAKLSSIFRWYKEGGAQLKYLNVRGRPREERRGLQLSVEELSTLFPAAKMQVDN